MGPEHCDSRRRPVSDLYTTPLGDPDLTGECLDAATDRPRGLFINYLLLINGARSETEGSWAPFSRCDSSTDLPQRKPSRGRCHNAT